MGTTGRKLRAAIAVVLGLCALVGFGYFLVTEGLDRADRWASVVAAFAALVGLGLTVWSLSSSTGSEPPAAAPPGTTVFIDSHTIQQGNHNTQSVRYGDFRGDHR